MTTYAVADKVPKGCDYLTAGKEYAVLQEWETFFSGDAGFSIIDNKGNLVDSTYEHSLHLNGGNWRRVEK